MEGWGALHELPEPPCPGIVLRHSHPSLWQHGLGKGFGALASTGHILPKTDPILIQNLASVWSQLREGRGGHSCSLGTSPLPSAMFSIMSCPPHCRVVVYPFIVQNSPTDVERVVGARAGGRGAGGGINHPSEGHSEMFVLVLEGLSWTRRWPQPRAAVLVSE